MGRGFKSILIISDMHEPYSHPDSVAFLSACKDKFKPDKVVCIGDEQDEHAINFHGANPDLLSHGSEKTLAREKFKAIFKLFPNCDVLDSNHGSLVYRRAKAHGLSASVIRSYRDILGAPKGWKWHFDLTLKMSDGRKVYFHHGKTSAAAKLSKNMSMCAVQGHYHSRFEIIYWANPTGLFWDMRVGCLIDDKSLAFEYNKTTMERPIIGVGVILDGQPKLVPMILNHNGRWIEEIR